MFICKLKINFILHILLKILERYCKLVILDTFDTHGFAYPKWYYQHVEYFCAYLQAKIASSLLMFFCRYCKDINFLLWTLWASLATHTQNDSINLQKTSMFIWMPKINFIIHFCLEILHFKKSWNLTGWQRFGP